MRRFLLIIQFMTRIPVKRDLDVSREDFYKGTIYFPIIGLIIGAFTVLCMYLSGKVFSPQLTAMIGVITHVFITGGIHLDGFSDTCDGIFSGRSKDKILEIMKDSRLGTFGGVGLILLILTRYVLYVEGLSIGHLYSINNLAYKFVLILLAPIAARSIVLFFMYKRKYARENEGLGDLFIGKVTLKEITISQIILFVIISVISYKFLLVYILSLLIMLLFRRYIEDILGGITGDILGCSIETTEILFMFLSLGLVNILWN